MKPEENLQAACVDYVRKCCPGVIVIASLNKQGPSKNSKAFFGYLAKMKKLGMVKGECDLRLHWLDQTYQYPMTCYIELKAGKNKPTDEQIDFMLAIRKLKIDADWTNSLEGFVNLLTKWGVPTNAR